MIQRLGIADLGSNTARLIVFSYEAGEWYRIIDGIREPIRLEPPTIELWEARKHAELFELAFGRRLEIEAGVTAD